MRGWEVDHTGSCVGFVLLRSQQIISDSALQAVYHANVQQRSHLLAGRVGRKEQRADGAAGTKVVLTLCTCSEGRTVKVVVGNRKERKKKIETAFSA